MFQNFQVSSLFAILSQNIEYISNNFNFEHKADVSVCISLKTVSCSHIFVVFVLVSEARRKEKTASLSAAIDRLSRNTLIFNRIIARKHWMRKTFVVLKLVHSESSRKVHSLTSAFCAIELSPAWPNILKTTGSKFFKYASHQFKSLPNSCISFRKSS